jgi:hypothetical protein
MPGQELLIIHGTFPLVALSISKSEPVRVNGPVSIAGSNSHTVAFRGPHHDPACVAAKAQEDETILSAGV